MFYDPFEKGFEADQPHAIDPDWSFNPCFPPIPAVGGYRAEVIAEVKTHFKI